MSRWQQQEELERAAAELQVGLRFLDEHGGAPDHRVSGDAVEKIYDAVKVVWSRLDLDRLRSRAREVALFGTALLLLESTDCPPRVSDELRKGLELARETLRETLEKLRRDLGDEEAEALLRGLPATLDRAAQLCGPSPHPPPEQRGGA